MQWKDLERITKENEDQKTVVVYVYHNPEDYPVFKAIAHQSVELGRVYIGPYSSYNKKHDHSFETECKRLQVENESLMNELRYKERKIDAIKDLLE